MLLALILFIGKLVARKIIQNLNQIGMEFNLINVVKMVQFNFKATYFAAMLFFRVKCITSPLTLVCVPIWYGF